MSVFLLCALLLHGQAAAVCSVAKESAPTEETIGAARQLNRIACDWLMLQGDPFMAEDAAHSLTSFVLPPAISPGHGQEFRSPMDQARPPCAPKAPCPDSLSRFSLTSFHPNAP